MGHPKADPQGGILEAIFYVTEKNDDYFHKWMIGDTVQKQGKIVLYDVDQITPKVTIDFWDAFLVDFSLIRKNGVLAIKAFISPGIMRYNGNWFLKQWHTTPMSSIDGSAAKVDYSREQERGDENEKPLVKKGEIQKVINETDRNCYHIEIKQ
jgi:hypothetical protein